MHESDAGKLFPLKNLSLIGHKLSRGNRLLRNNPTAPEGLKIQKSSEGTRTGMGTSTFWDEISTPNKCLSQNQRIITSKRGLVTEAFDTKLSL